MLRVLLLIILLMGLAGAKRLDIQNKCVGSVESFSKDQKETIIKAIEFGNKHSLGYTLGAIAWQESCAGEYLVNFQDPSAGVFHAYIPNLLRKYKNLSDNGFTVNMVGQKLINDFDFSAQEAINELKYWEKVHKGKWENMIKSYNKGFSWEKNQIAAKKAQSYYLSVSSKVRKLQKYFEKNNINQILIARQSPDIPIYKNKNNNFDEQNKLAEFIMIEY
jgi:hypothetical protein